MVDLNIVSRKELASHMIRGLELSASPPTTEEGWGPRDWVQSYGQWFNQSYLHNKASIKNVRTMRFGELLHWWTCQCAGKVVILKMAWSSVSLSLHFVLIIFSICLFLSYTPYNKSVVVTIELFWVLLVVLANYWTWMGVMATPNSQSEAEKVWVVWQAYLGLVSKVGTVLSE